VAFRFEGSHWPAECGSYREEELMKGVAVPYTVPALGAAGRGRDRTRRRRGPFMRKRFDRRPLSTVVFLDGQPECRLFAREARPAP